jgi:hypothetical protein
MGPRRWRWIAMAAILPVAALAVSTSSVLARPATTPSYSLTASAATALSDVDDVLFDASGTTVPGCPTITSYVFSFGDGTSTSSTYAYAYHYFHQTSATAPPFDVTLTVVACGEIYMDPTPVAETVVIDTGPKAVLTVTNSSSSPYDVYADASASTDAAPSYLYEYDFSWGDETPDSVTYAPHASFKHTYTTSGPETVTVYVYDDGGMMSQQSQTVSVIPFTSPPASPSTVSASAGDTKVTVIWAAPTSGGTPSHYMINTYADDSSSPVITTTVAGTKTQATVTGLTDGTTYAFTVTAVVGGSDSAASQRSNPVIPVGKPASPTSVNAVQDSTAAVVQWIAPTKEGSRPFSYHQGINYIVTTTSTTPNAPSVKPFPVTGDPAPTNATIPGLVSGDSYDFQVTASTETASGSTLTSPPSSASPAIKLITLGPTLTEQPQLKLEKPSTVASGDDPPITVDVVWTASAGSAGSSPECGYDIRRSLNNGSWIDETPSLLTAESFSDNIPSASPQPYVVRYEVGIVTSTDCSNSSDWIYSAWSQSSQFAGREEPDSEMSKFKYSAGWAPTTCSNCTDGEDMVTTTKGATITVTLNSAFNIGLIFTDAPTYGSVSVGVTLLASGQTVTIPVNTSKPPQGFRQLLFKIGWAMFQAATITVTTTSAAPVDFDGAIVLYAPLARLAT